MQSLHARGSLLVSFLVVAGGAALAACGDSGAGGAGGSADTSTSANSTTGGTKTTSTTATTTTGSTSSASGTSSSASASTTAASSTSASSSSTGIQMCVDVPVEMVSSDFCDPVGALALSLTDNVQCTSEDFSVWPVKVYSLPVAANDCIHVRVTNVAGATEVSDLFATVIDNDGGNYIFEDDVDCIEGNGDGFCPDGGLTMPTAGTAYIAVGAYTSDIGSPGCASGSTDYDIRVSVNGTDFDIGSAPVCLSDVNILVQ